MPNLQDAVKFMIDTANDNSHGYDQTHRNSPDYDCSSLVGTALNKAGFNVSPNSWTGNLRKQLVSCGFATCTRPWKAGDIHLKEGKHVCMSIDSNRIAQASINEKGTTTGGKPGDQTGNEINIKAYYEYKGGWDYHLRYTPKSSTGNVSRETVAREVIAGKWGTGEDRKKHLTDAGYVYTDIQQLVNKILKQTKTEDEIAREVIQGKWSTGDERKEKLTNAGYDYSRIQHLVNEILR